MDQALVTYLRQTTAIAALVSTRIEWGLRPQGSALPALGLKVVSRFPVSSDEGASGLWQGRVQFDCWGANQTAAKALKDALILVALPEGKRLDTGWDRSTNAVQLTQNNAHASVYQRTQAGNNIEVISTASAAGLTLGGSTAASDSGSSRLNTNTRVTPALSGTLPQQRMSRRNASTDVSIVSDGVQILAPTAAASSALNNSDIYIGRRDTVYTASQVAGLSIGAYFDDTEALAFYNAWHNYMVAVGADT